MTNNSVNSLRGIPSAILTEDQQQALLELLKEINSIFWGPDQKKCVALLKESFFDPFEKINALPGVCLQKVLDRSGIKIREGFRFPNIFSRSIKQPLKCNYTSYAEALYFS